MYFCFSQKFYFCYTALQDRIACLVIQPAQIGRKKKNLSFLRVSKFDNTDFSTTLWLLIWRKVYKTNVLLQGLEYKTKKTQNGLLYLEQTLIKNREKMYKKPECSFCNLLHWYSSRNCPKKP